MYRIAVVGFVLPLVVSPVLAEDANVPRAVLVDLGLESLQIVTDDAGMQVRGMSSYAFATGASLVVGQLLDNQNAGEFFFASDANSSASSSENAGLNAISTASQGPQGSSVFGMLDVSVGNPPVQVFLGNFLGNAGNAANFGAAGLSAATAN